jgi:hypothetical protein
VSLPCGMLLDYEGARIRPCGKPARRIIAGMSQHGCCDQCFEALYATGDWGREEMEAEYPLEEP